MDGDARRVGCGQHGDDAMLSGDCHAVGVSRPIRNFKGLIIMNRVRFSTRCQIIPEPNHEVSVQIDGRERLRWHAGTQYTRPFFYPLIGPSGASLTRIGHPGASNHDHHKSVWFAHQQSARHRFLERKHRGPYQAAYVVRLSGRRHDECLLAANLQVVRRPRSQTSSRSGIDCVNLTL